MALPTRLRTAVVSRSESPKTFAPRANDDTISAPLDPATSLGCRRADVDQLRIVQGTGDLKTGKIDDLLDQTGEPRALHLHPVGKACHCLRSIVDLQEALGQQSQ